MALVQEAAKLLLVLSNPKLFSHLFCNHATLYSKEEYKINRVIDVILVVDIIGGILAVNARCKCLTSLLLCSLLSYISNPFSKTQQGTRHSKHSKHSKGRGKAKKE